MNKNLKLVLSYIPLILVIIYGIYGYFNGASFITAHYNGFAALDLNIFCAGFLLAPFLLWGFIYQFDYYFSYNKKYKKVGIIQIVIMAIIILLPIVFIFTDNLFSLVSQHKDKIEAQKMIKKADVILPFDNIYDKDEEKRNVLGIKGYYKNTIFIAEKEYQVGFLLKRSDKQYDEYNQTKLTKVNKGDLTFINIINNSYVEAIVPLKYPYKRLISFYKSYIIYDEENEDYENYEFIKTIMIEKEDGEILISIVNEKNDKDNMFETNLDQSEYSVEHKTKYFQYE